MVLAFYYGWFGSRLSATRAWAGWTGEKLDYSVPNAPPKPMGITYNPDRMDSQPARALWALACVWGVRSKGTGI